MSSILAATFSLESMDSSLKDCSSSDSNQELSCEWAAINHGLTDSKASGESLLALELVQTLLSSLCARADNTSG